MLQADKMLLLVEVYEKTFPTARPVEQFHLDFKEYVNSVLQYKVYYQYCKAILKADLTWPGSPCRTRWFCRESATRCRRRPRRSCPLWRCSIRWWGGAASGGRSTDHRRPQTSNRRTRSQERGETGRGWGRHRQEVTNQYKPVTDLEETAGQKSSNTSVHVGKILKPVIKFNCTLFITC